MQIKIILKQETPGLSDKLYQTLLVTILDNNREVVNKVNTASDMGQSG